MFVNKAKQVYAVGTEYNHVVKHDVLTQGTVERIEPGTGVQYEIVNRAGDRIRCDADSIKALIAALQAVSAVV